MSMINKTVIILAGGKATRLNGFPKSHLLYSNTETFIERLLKETEDFNERIISSNNSFLFNDFEPEVYEDDIKGIGPLGGIYTCLKRMKTDEALVIGVSMPNITKDFLKRLSEKELKGDCIIPIYSEGIQPLCGLYSKKMLPIIEKHIKLKDYDMESLIKDSRAFYIAEEDQKTFLNISTFKEYYNM